MRVFKDYDSAAEKTATIVTDAEKTTTPVKGNAVVVTTPRMELPLTPPATIRSETTSLDLQFESREIVNDRTVARRKRRKISTRSEGRES